MYHELFYTLSVCKELAQERLFSETGRVNIIVFTDDLKGSRTDNFVWEYSTVTHVSICVNYIITSICLFFFFKYSVRLEVER